MILYQKNPVSKKISTRVASDIVQGESSKKISTRVESHTVPEKSSK